MIAVLLALATCTSAQNDQGAEKPLPAPPVVAEITPDPTLIPPPSQEPVTVQPPNNNLGAFVLQLESAVSNQDWTQMEALMSDPINVGSRRSEWRLYVPNQLTTEFGNASLPSPLAVKFSSLSAEEMIALLDQPPVIWLSTSYQRSL